jgi:NADH-quinone oxidoreductase subunit J
MTAVEIVFVLLGVVVLASAVLVVTTRRMVHAALWLCVGFGALGVCYLLLTAEVIAWVQVLIYVGAITVLLLFGMMLTHAPTSPSPEASSANRPAALAVAVGLAGLLVTVVVQAFGTAWLDLGGPPGDARTIGAALFQGWVLPFELLSVLLLAALIGAVVLSRTDIGRKR